MNGKIIYCQCPLFILGATLPEEMSKPAGRTPQLAAATRSDGRAAGGDTTDDQRLEGQPRGGLRTMIQGQS